MNLKRDGKISPVVDDVDAQDYAVNMPDIYAKLDQNENMLEFALLRLKTMEEKHNESKTRR